MQEEHKGSREVSYQKGYTPRTFKSRIGIFRTKSSKSAADQERRRINEDAIVRYTAHLTVATWVIAISSIFTFGTAIVTYIVLRGQLQAMNRDQQPDMTVGDEGSPVFHEVNNSGIGQILWTWEFLNSGKGIARNLLIKHYMSLNHGHFQPSFKVDPSTIDDFSVGEKRVILTASAPSFTKQEFDKFYAGFLDIRLRITFIYSDDGGDNLSKTVCMGKSNSGRIAFISAAGCQE